MLTAENVLDFPHPEDLKEVIERRRIDKRILLAKMDDNIPMANLHATIERLEQDGIKIKASQLNLVMRLFPVQRANLIDNCGPAVIQQVREVLCQNYIGCSMVATDDREKKQRFISILNYAIEHYPL